MCFADETRIYETRDRLLVVARTASSRASARFERASLGCVRVSRDVI